MLLNAKHSLNYYSKNCGFAEELPECCFVPMNGMSHVMAVKQVREANRASQLSYAPEVDAAAGYWRAWAYKGQ